MKFLEFVVPACILVLWADGTIATTARDKFGRQRKAKAGKSIQLGFRSQMAKLEDGKMGVIMKKVDAMEKKIVPTDQQKESELLITLLQLPKDYNKFELPVTSAVGDTVAFPISVAVRIRNIRGIDVLNEEIGMELDLITHWTDFALKKHHRNQTNEPRVLDSGFLKEIWWPHLFFSRTVSVIRPDLHGSLIIPRPVKLSINPSTGEVEMSSRLVLKLYCPMDFTYYPADTQVCNVTLRSYDQSMEDVSLRWRENRPGIPEAFFFNRAHPNFEIHMHNVTTLRQSIVTITNITTVHTQLQFSLSTRRLLSFHVMQTYVPSIFLVVITWLAFFIPMELLEARIGISMTILLTLTAMFGSIKEYTPQVSYIKAIDTWMLVCIVFVFLTLFEFTFLMYLRHINDQLHAKALETTMDKVCHGEFDPDGSNISNIELVKKCQQKTFEKYAKVTKLYRIATRMVETYGFITVSVGFLIFNAAYWPWLFSNSKYYSYTVNVTHNE